MENCAYLRKNPGYAPGDHVHLCPCLVHDNFFPFDRTSSSSETAEILMFLRFIAINLSMRIENSVFYIRSMLVFFISLLGTLGARGIYFKVGENALQGVHDIQENVLLSNLELVFLQAI